MFVNEKKSPNAIARYFNEHEVAGKKSWDPTTMTSILQRATYKGVEHDGMRKSRKDSKTGKLVWEKRPQSEWRERQVPHLRIVSDELWDAAQLRMRSNSEAFAAKGGARGGRASAYPKTLLRPYCGYCDRDLSLGHSGKNPSFCCATGVRKKHKCKLTGYKSVNIVESAILKHFEKTFANEATLTQLVKLANQEIAKAASEPATDTGPLRKAVEKLTARGKRLLTAIELNDDEPVEELSVKYRQCREEIEELKLRIKSIEGTKNVRPKRISKKEVAALLKDLRSLLAGDLKKAASALVETLGPIRITVLPDSAGGKPVWQAEFSGNLVPLIKQVAQKCEYPSAQTWEYLTLRGWTFSINADVRLEIVPQYVEMAPILTAMSENGDSVNAIAAATGLCWRTVADILEYSRTGKLPDSKNRPTVASRARGSARPSNPPYARHAERVVELRKKGLSFRAIAEQISGETGDHIAMATVRRGFDYWKGRNPNAGLSQLRPSSC